MTEGESSAWVICRLVEGTWQPMAHLLRETHAEAMALVPVGGFGGQPFSVRRARILSVDPETKQVAQ